MITLYLTFTSTLSGAPSSFASHPLESLRYAAFHVVSLITSTGFVTTDYALWPSPACVILFVIMFIGGCGGSTAGGMKCVRAMMLGKHSYFEVKRCILPHMIPECVSTGDP